MKIEDLNPWWLTGKIQEEYSVLKKRRLFNEIVKYLSNRQIISLNGIRRVGKTVTLHHIIELLLKNVPKENIVYYSFDLMAESLEDVLKEYSEKLKIDFKKEKIFVFFDEIQKHSGWENELKLIYDNYPNVKLFISGSASLFIEKKSKESLAGRVLSFLLKTLDFKEYLILKNVSYDENKISLYSSVLQKYFGSYLLSGGLPEIINEPDSMKIDKYISDLIMDKVIFIDIPAVFKIEEPALLKELFKIISSNPGMICDYESLANDLKRDRKTISNYLLYLEKAFLIRKIYNYSNNALTSEKRLKRFYPSSSAFCYLFSDVEIGKIVETGFLMNLDINFFSRSGEREIDFIMLDKKKINPIEIKYRNKIKISEFSELIRFCHKNDLKSAFILTKDYKSEEIFEQVTLKFIPISEWLVIR